jgi:predicted alpha/beta hydrolase
MSRWSDASSWSGEGLRREVFFFDSSGTPLYGSLYRGEPARSRLGLVACGSWGVESDRTDPLVRSVALAVAALGGTAMVFHYPGYGDSYGDLASVGMDDLVEATRAALAEATRRSPDTGWLLAGFMFGASVACLAGERSSVDGMLLVQPALRPGGYFRWLADYGKRQPLRFAVSEGMAYGYPLPSRMLEHADELDEAVAAAPSASSVPTTAIRYAKPAEQEPLREGWELVEADGTWRFGSTLDPPLVEAASAWLGRRAEERAR